MENKYDIFTLWLNYRCKLFSLCLDLNKGKRSLIEILKGIGHCIRIK